MIQTMKKNIFNCLLAGVALVAFSGCNDFLEDNRYPLDQQVDSPTYWTSEPNVNAQTVQLYTNFSGYGSGASWSNNFYYKSLNDDQCSKIESGSGSVFCPWTYQYAPSANSVWDASYTVIRRCNYIINNSNLESVAKNNHYIGIARMVRAMQYYDLVKALGDVPLVTTVLNVDSPEVYGERINRNTVMDFALEDLNFAIANIMDQSSEGKVTFSKDLAQAVKSEICLYEGGFSKYHLKDTERANKYYTEVINACNAIMGQGYSVCDDYRSLYNSYQNEDKTYNIPGLSSNPEVIFMKAYAVGSLTHSAVSFLSSETPICGMTKDAFDSYLFRDGKPKATTSLPTTDIPVIDAEGNFTIGHMLEVRDARLGETIDDQLAFGTKVTFKRNNSNAITSTTGYTIKKYVNPNSPNSQTVNANTNLTCAPIYWLARTYTEYLEARAEMGTITDADLTKCMKPLWDRAKINANPTLSYLNAMQDPANNMGVSSLIWEIRRLRRSEMMFDQDHRYWDLIRWHQLELLDTTKPENVNIILGANVTGATDAQLLNVYTNEAKYINGARNANGTETRVFTEREYLQPLGTAIITLYKNKDLVLEQNPGWSGN